MPAFNVEEVTVTEAPLPDVVLPEDALKLLTAGGALTVIKSGPNVEVQPLLLLTSTVIKAPLVNEVELNVLAELFWTLDPFTLKL